MIGVDGFDMNNTSRRLRVSSLLVDKSMAPVQWQKTACILFADTLR